MTSEKTENVWYKQAEEKLERELKSVSFDRYGQVMKDGVHAALLDFCRQDGEFAQAVVQGGSFSDCMKAVAKGVGTGISDLEAYRRAVRFYFKGADVRFHMTVCLTADVDRDEPAPKMGAAKVMDLDFDELF